jgi:branched-chain amino acid transport system substrate-binding protein
MVGDMAGLFSELGVSGRYGAELSIREINREGGIDGRELELLVESHNNSPQLAEARARELDERGAQAIIGFFISAMSAPMQRVAEAEELLFLSPTISDGTLTGIDDNILRLIPDSTEEGSFLAKYILARGDVRRVALLHESRNTAYSAAVTEACRRVLTRAGVEIALSAMVEGEWEQGMRGRLRALAGERVDALVVIASAPDVALTCQLLSERDRETPVFSSMWAMTGDLLRLGGRSVERCYISGFYNPFLERPAFMRFKERYRAAYGREPSFASAFAYEAAEILAYGLAHREKPNTAALKRAILEKGVFRGIQGEIRFDDYGDVERQAYIFTVRNGQFAPVVGQ